MKRDSRYRSEEKEKGARGMGGGGEGEKPDTESKRKESSQIHSRDRLCQPFGAATIARCDIERIKNALAVASSSEDALSSSLDGSFYSKVTRKKKKKRNKW